MLHNKWSEIITYLPVYSKWVCLSATRWRHSTRAAIRQCISHCASDGRPILLPNVSWPQTKKHRNLPTFHCSLCRKYVDCMLQVGLNNSVDDFHSQRIHIYRNVASALGKSQFKNNTTNSRNSSIFVFLYIVSSLW